MTIDEHRKLDAQIDREVFNISLRERQKGELVRANWRRTAQVPRYSTDIAKAWEVKDKVHSGHFADCLRAVIARRLDASPDWRERGMFDGCLLGYVTPEDICRAALEAVRSEEAQAA